MKKILEVRNITKIYKTYKNNIDRLKELFTHKKYHKEFVSTDNVSFDLFEGETLGIIGVNGAGKSTLLKMIAGVISPSSGEIVRHGRVTALLELGTGFNDELSGIENIFLNGSLIGMTHKECEVKQQDIIAFSELGEYIYEPIKTYSSGMKMRLAFSIAIYSQPQILIVDEALFVGDAHFSAKCTKALRDRKKNNMSIIYVSHDLNSLKLLCDRVLLLNQGRLIKDGLPEDVVNYYNFLIAKLNNEQGIVSVSENQEKSFGTFDIEIKEINLLGKISQSNKIYSGEESLVSIILESKQNLDNMTIGILIKDKLGQDIFGTNTFYHNIDLAFKSGKRYLCCFNINLNIGLGEYYITVAVHSDSNHTQNCVHWFNNACNFEVNHIKNNHFIGICKLEPIITFKEMES